jgi:putative hydrolase of the HAD superfamily
MNQINTIVFDLGGVIVTIDHEEAIRRFREIGLKDAENHLDPYTQTGIFGDLERGIITASTFVRELSKLTGRQQSFESCLYAWLGYRKEVPQRNLDTLKQLRAEGYRLVLLSNTNPFMMNWAMSKEFDGQGKPLSHYFDSLVLSYQHKMMKPDPNFYHEMLMEEEIWATQTLFVDDSPRNVAAASQLGMRTYCPENGADWTKEIYKYLF